MFAGVYRLASAPPGALPSLQAALLLGGPQSVVSHRSAAWLWGLCDEPPTEPVVTVPRNRVLRATGVRAVRSVVPGRAVRRRKELRCTDVIRTLLDCACVVDAATLDDMIDRAIAARHTSIDRIVAALDRAEHRNHKGRGRLVRRLASRGLTGAPNPSVLESRMARIFRRARLPVPKVEVRWGPRQRYRLDFAYPAIRLVIEVDGVVAHGRPETMRYDHRRDRELQLAGWTVMRFDWWEVTHEADRVAAEIEAMYRKLAAA
jgi:very-short-patch-repair endonuclease